MHKGSTTWETFFGICESLLDIHDDVMHIFAHPKVSLTMDRYEYMRMKADIAEVHGKRAEKELRRKNIAKIRKKATNIEITFTQKGKIELLKYAIITSTKRLPEKQFCLVSFDVPESAAQVRKMWRSFLSEAGFRRLHRSVWISSKDTVALLRLLVKKLNIDDWMYVFVVIRS